MTSVKGKLKTNSLTPADIKYFWDNKGSVPLCCIHIEFAHPRTQKRYKEPLYKCDQLKKGIPYAKFEKFCLKCQREIEEALERSDKDESEGRSSDIRPSSIRAVFSSFINYLRSVLDSF